MATEEVFKDFDVVKVLDPLSGKWLKGVIVMIHDSGEAFEVELSDEIEDPTAKVITVAAENIRAIKPKYTLEPICKS